MSLGYVIGALGQAAARGAGRAITSPWFWNALNLGLFLEQEHEIHTLMAAERARQSAGPQQQIPGAPEGCVWPPRVGSGEWYEYLEEIENEMALAPAPLRCTCGECGDYHGDTD